MSFYDTFLDISLSYSAGVVLVLLRELPPDRVTQGLQISVALATILKLFYDVWRTERNARRPTVRKPKKRALRARKKGQ